MSFLEGMVAPEKDWPESEPKMNKKMLKCRCCINESFCGALEAPSTRIDVEESADDDSEIQDVLEDFDAH